MASSKFIKIDGGGSNEVEEIIGNSNPMMNDVILKHLIQVSSSSSSNQLGNFRLVCSRWNSVVLPQWLQTIQPIRLTNQRQNDTFFKFIREVHLQDEDEDKSLSDQKTFLKRYPKFELIIYKIDGINFPYQLFEVFWAEAGRWLTHLSLDFQNITFPEHLTFIKIFTCKYTPNLESLEVKMDRMKELDTRLAIYWAPPKATTKLKRFQLELGAHQNEQNYINIFAWDAIFGYHPNLTHFGLKPDYYCHIPEFTQERILDAIMDMRNKDAGNLMLTSFQWYMSGPLHDKLCETLRKAAWSLESISLNLAQGEEETIHNILSIHAGTLKHLEIQRYRPLERSPFTGMGHLESLILTELPMKNLQFLVDLSSLRSLSLLKRIVGADPRIRVIFSSTQLEEGQTFPSISKFCCNYKEGWSADDIIRLANLMPNVTHLELMLTDANFRQVCSSLPRLEHLVVCLSSNPENSLGDRGIVGLVRNGDEVNYTLPNITNLQMLRSVELGEVSPEWGSGRDQLSYNFTEHSIKHGFLRLPKLEKLIINVRRMNPEVKQLIEATFPFAKVTTGA